MENDLDILLNMAKLSLMELDDLKKHSDEIDEELSNLGEYLQGVLTNTKRCRGLYHNETYGNL
jgi:hypothetical protein